MTLEVPVNSRDIFLQASLTRTTNNSIPKEEKPGVINSYNQILADKTILTAQATKYGIVTELSDYTIAVTNLTNYLNTLVIPVAWDDTSNSTLLQSRNVFDSMFTTVMQKRVALQLVIDTFIGAEDQTPPPKASGLATTPSFASIVLNWNPLADMTKISHTEVWRATTNDRSTAALIGQAPGFVYVDNIGLSASFYYWVRFVSTASVKGLFNADINLGTIGTTGQDSTYVMQILLNKLGYDQFNVASGVFPVRSETSLPVLPNVKYPIGVLVTLTTNGKLYRNVGNVWKSDVAATDLTGQITSSQIADSSLGVAKFASGIEPVTIVTGVPVVKSTTIVFNTVDSKQYRWNGTAYIASVPTVDLVGTIATAQIAPGAIDSTKFASSIEPTTIVTSVPSTKLTNAIFNTTDRKLYRWNGTAYIASTATSDLSGQIQANQIQANSITANQIAADTITAGQIAAGAITASEIAAGSITTSKMAITDITNICTNPNGDMGVEGWAGIAGVTTNQVQGIPIGVNVLTNTSRDCFFGIPFDATVGEQYAISVDLLNSNSNSVIRFGFAELDSSNAVLNYNSNGPQLSPITGSGSWKRISGFVTITNANTARIRIYVQIQGFGADIGTWYMHNVNYRRAANAELIVDGSITALKIAANTITANNIAANTITAAKIAANTITAAQIAANTITASQIATDTITAGQIASGAITAAEIAAGAITTDKLAVVSKGAALNADPNFGDQTAWSTFNNMTIATVIDGKSGNKVARSSTTGQISTASSISFPLIAGKVYRVSGLLRSITAVHTAYVRLARLNSLGQVIYDMAGIENVSVPIGVWTEFSGIVTVEPLAVNGRLDLYLRWTLGGSGYVEAQNIRCEELIGSTLIQDGAITTSKILAGSIDANKLAANSVTAGKIAAGSIVAGDGVIANAAIGSAQIINVTADKIDTRGLTIKNAAGTVIFGSGTPLTSDYANIPVGGKNKIPNSGPILNQVGQFKMLYANSTTGSPFIFGPSFAPYMPTGSGGVYTRVVGTANSDSYSYISITLPQSTAEMEFPVIVGKRYEASVYLSAHRCNGTISMLFLNEAGGVILDVASSIVTSTPSGPLSAWESSRAFSIATAPANSSRVIIRCLLSGNGGVNPYLFASMWYFGEALPVQTTPSPWSDSGSSFGGNISGQITPDLVSTYISNAAINLAQINTASIGQLSALTATIGLLRSRASGGRTEIADDIIRVYNDSNLLKIKIGKLN